MKKIALSTILLLLVLITAVAFVSCDRAPSNTTTPTTEPTTEPTTDPNGGNNGDVIMDIQAVGLGFLLDFHFSFLLIRFCRF